MDEIPASDKEILEQEFKGKEGTGPTVKRQASTEAPKGDEATPPKAKRRKGRQAGKDKKDDLEGEDVAVKDEEEQGGEKEGENVEHEGEDEEQEGEV